MKLNNYISKFVNSTINAKEFIENMMNEKRFFEMAMSILPKDTGLPMNIWVSEQGHTKHWMRIKVQKDYSHRKNMEHNSFTITIPDKEIKGNTGIIKPSEINLVKNFIDINLKILIDYWNYEIDSKDFFKAMKKVPSF